MVFHTAFNSCSASLSLSEGVMSCLSAMEQPLSFSSDYALKNGLYRPVKDRTGEEK